MMIRKSLLLTVIYLSVHISNAANFAYTVPEPLFEVFKERGFRVSIPDSDGVSLFAFHGNLNQPLVDLEAGEFSQDVLSVRNGRWTYENRDMKLKPGDKIHYWLFVIHRRLGYRKDRGLFVVSELLDDEVYSGDAQAQGKKEQEVQQLTHQLSSTQPPPAPEVVDATIRICERTILNLTQAVFNLQNEIESLRDTNNILRDIAQKHPPASRTLKVDGRIPTNDDPLDTVQAVIREKLHLPITVVKAVRDSDKRITFEVDSFDDKLAIIRAAKTKLSNSNINIIY